MHNSYTSHKTCWSITYVTVWLYMSQSYNIEKDIEDFGTNNII